MPWDMHRLKVRELRLIRQALEQSHDTPGTAGHGELPPGWDALPEEGVMGDG